MNNGAEGGRKNRTQVKRLAQAPTTRQPAGWRAGKAGRSQEAVSTADGFPFMFRKLHSGQTPRMKARRLIVGDHPRFSNGSGLLQAKDDRALLGAS